MGNAWTSGLVGEGLGLAEVQIQRDISAFRETGETGVIWVARMTGLPSESRGRTFAWYLRDSRQGERRDLIRLQHFRKW